MPRTSASNDDAPIVAGVRISHADRVIYPDLGITKLDLAGCYQAVADWIVPHVAGRLLTLVHCPKGLAGPCHYPKHSKLWGPGCCGASAFRSRPRLVSIGWPTTRPV